METNKITYGADSIFDGVLEAIEDFKNIVIFHKEENKLEFQKLVDKLFDVRINYYYSDFGQAYIQTFRELGFKL